MSWRQTLHALWDPLAEVRRQLEGHSRPEGTPTAFLKGLQFQLDRRLGCQAPSALRGLFKGHGVDFLSLREYQPGDDVRKIDWNVLARTGTLSVKQHYEERQVPVWFFIDLTAPMHWGQSLPKLETVKTLVGLLGLIALNAGHRVGFVLWDGTAMCPILPLQRGTTHLEHALYRIDTKMTEGVSQVEGAECPLPELSRLFQGHSLVFFLSDFAFLDHLSPETVGRLGQLRRHHQISAMMVLDAVEEHLVMGRGWLPLGRPQPTWVDTDDRWAVRAYIKAFRKMSAERERILKTFASVHRLSSGQNLLDVVLQWARAA